PASVGSRHEDRDYFDDGSRAGVRNRPATASTPIAISGKNHHSRPFNPPNGSRNDCGLLANWGAVCGPLPVLVTEELPPGTLPALLPNPLLVEPPPRLPPLPAPGTGGVLLLS